MRISDWSSDVCSSDLQRFEPISLLAGVASDFADLGNYMTPEESDRFELNLSIAVAKNITSKTWLSGLSAFFDVLSDPERYVRNYVARLAGSMAVPAMVSPMARAYDPNLRVIGQRVCWEIVVTNV